MSSGTRQEPPAEKPASTDDARHAPTPPGGQPRVAAPLTIEEARARLAEGLLPGEDIFFYDLDRFGQRRPAQPSEKAVYEPPREPAAPDTCATPSDAEKVVVQVTGNTVPPPLRVTPALRGAQGASDEKRLAHLGRARTRDLAYSFFIVSAASLIGWWLLIWQHDSDAHRKVPSSLVPQSAIVLRPKVKEEATTPEKPSAISPIVASSPQPVTTPRPPLQSASPRPAKRLPRPITEPDAFGATPGPSAESPEPDPGASNWIHQER